MEKLVNYYQKFLDAAEISPDRVVCIKAKDVGQMLMRARGMFGDDSWNHIEIIICQYPGRDRQTAMFRNMVYDYFVTKDMFCSLTERYL